MLLTEVIKVKLFSSILDVIVIVGWVEISKKKQTPIIQTVQWDYSYTYLSPQ